MSDPLEFVLKNPVKAQTHYVEQALGGGYDFDDDYVHPFNFEQVDSGYMEVEHFGLIQHEKFDEIFKLAKPTKKKETK